MIGRRPPRRSAAALAGTARYDVEYRVIRPDGGVRVVHSQGDVTRDESGRPLRQFGVLQDITERRRAEDELSEVKERFRVLAESSLTGIYLATEDGFVYANPAMARMFGYAVDEIVGGLHSVDLTAPEDRSLVAENMRRRLRDGVEELRYEFRGLRKDGSVFPVEVHGRRIEHAGKIAVLGTIVDNTERRRAEDELRASEARFRTLVDHAADAFFLIDERCGSSMSIGGPARASATAATSSSACIRAISMPPWTIRPLRGSRSEPRLARRSPSRRSPAQGRDDVPGRDPLARLPAGGKLFYLALVRDITERKRAEESLRQSEAYLAEAQRLSHTGSWALDLATNQYVYTSEESDRMWGFDPRGEKPSAASRLRTNPSRGSEQLEAQPREIAS